MNYSNNEFIKKDIKIRNVGIDFMRILGMYAIIIHHILLHGKVIYKYKYIKLNLLNILCFWHVSSFALISGIVGYKNYKYSNLIYLWICTLFYSVIIHLIFRLYFPIFKNKQIFYEFFPVIFNRYWYFTEYFGMYLFLPLINNGVINLNENDFKILIISFHGIFIIWKDFINFRSNIFHMNNGHSTIWLLSFFITGAYISKYKLKIYNKKSFLFCLKFITIFISSSILSYYPKYYNLNFNKFLVNKLKQIFDVRVNSFSMILQSISLTLFITTQINYSKIFEKIITFIGPLTFGVYLIHEHKFIRAYIITFLFKKIPIKLSLKVIIFLVLIKGILIFFICIIIDYLRNLIFYYLKVKKFCVFLEKSIKLILKNI